MSSSYYLIINDGIYICGWYLCRVGKQQPKLDLILQEPFIDHGIIHKGVTLSDDEDVESLVIYFWYQLLSSKGAIDI